MARDGTTNILLIAMNCVNQESLRIVVFRTIAGSQELRPIWGAPTVHVHLHFSLKKVKNKIYRSFKKYFSSLPLVFRCLSIFFGKKIFLAILPTQLEIGK